MKKVLVFLLFLIFAYLPIGRVFSVDKVEINTASLQQLDEIIGIGPALGQRIIDTRPFSSIDDLIKVKGIGEKTLQKIKEQGLAWVQEQSEQPITETPAETSIETSIEEPTTKVYPGGVIINEILPSPEGPDETEEWIEIFNQNDFEVELASWQIKDKEGKTTTHTFSEGIKITALGYLVLKRPETKIILNNSGDGLELIQPNGNVLDSINFGKAPQNQSYNKTPSGWDWNNILTPGAKNITSSPQGKQEPTPTAQFVEKQEANIALSPKDSNYPVILIALIVAVFSTGAVLVLKKYINIDKS